MVFSIVVMAAGLLWAGFIVGNIMSIVASLDRASARKRQRIDDVEKLIKYAASTFLALPA